MDASGYSADESIELDVRPEAEEAVEAAEEPIEIDDIEEIEVESDEVDAAPIAVEAAEDAAAANTDEPEMELQCQAVPADAESDEAEEVDEVPPLEFTPFEPIHDEPYELAVTAPPVDWSPNSSDAAVLTGPCGLCGATATR